MGCFLLACGNLPRWYAQIEAIRPRISEGKWKSTQVFDDIRIAKVGIDIEKQLQWLQRDFSVFSANVFDFKEIFKH